MLEIVNSEDKSLGKPQIGGDSDLITRTSVSGVEYTLFKHTDSVVLYGRKGERKIGTRNKIGNEQAAFIRGMTRVLVSNSIPTFLVPVPRKMPIGRPEKLRSNEFHAIVTQIPSLIFEVTFDTKSGNAVSELALQNLKGDIIGSISESVLNEACDSEESHVAIAILAGYPKELLSGYIGAAKFAKTAAGVIRDFWIDHGYYELKGIRITVGMKGDGTLVISDAIRIYDCYIKTNAGLPVGRYLYENIKSFSKPGTGDALVKVQSDANILADIADTEM